MALSCTALKILNTKQWKTEVVKFSDIMIIVTFFHLSLHMLIQLKIFTKLLFPRFWSIQIKEVLLPCFNSWVCLLATHIIKWGGCWSAIFKLNFCIIYCHVQYLLIPPLFTFSDFLVELWPMLTVEHNSLYIFNNL